MAAALHIRREENAGRTTLWLEGTFDRSTAQQLGESIAEVNGPVVVDFSQVRTFKDSAVDVLTRAMKEGVSLRGIGSHQERLLRYFGLATERPSERYYYRPEDVLGI
jgi:anti-anti-sigma regulatory factor